MRNNKYENCCISKTKENEIKNPFMEMSDLKKKGNLLLDDFIKKSSPPTIVSLNTEYDEEQVIIVRYKKNSTFNPDSVVVEYANGCTYDKNDELALCAAVGTVMCEDSRISKVLGKKRVYDHMAKSVTNLLFSLMLEALFLKSDK